MMAGGLGDRKVAWMVERSAGSSASERVSWRAVWKVLWRVAKWVACLDSWWAEYLGFWKVEWMVIWWEAALVQRTVVLKDIALVAW